MKLKKIVVKNFKGIQHLELDLSKTPGNNVYTLVGINESGKTTILEALDYFEYNDDKALKEISNASQLSENDIIPINKRSNFNDSIEIKFVFELDDEDIEDVTKFAEKKCGYKLSELPNELSLTQKYVFKDSKLQGNHQIIWDVNLKGIKKGRKKETNLFKEDNEIWRQLIELIKQKMPKVLYFPTTLFDFPDKIYLNGVNVENKGYKPQFYKAVVQDILDSLGDDLNIQTHIIDRMNSGIETDKENIDQLALKMSEKITKEITDEWSEVLKNRDYEVVVYVKKDEQGCYVEFKVKKGSEGIFKLSERSLGFRWFFVFLLITQFRGFRKNENKQVIFLFDEPAANLSRNAQNQLLKSLERISDKCSIIYTTHSQYLINPNWLEGAFVVTNSALEKDELAEYDTNKTNIKIERYRSYVNSHPQNTSYFQPILDVLEYVPNELDFSDSAVIFEGKNDYYTLNYFFKIMLGKSDLIMIPGMSCDSAHNLISLYAGWGKNAVVVLDSDSAGEDSKKEYLNKFGPLVEEKLVTFKDINKKWFGKCMEKILSKQERISIQQMCYPDSKTYNKKLFNKTLQELLMTNTKVNVSEETLNNFEIIYNYLSDKLKNDLVH